MKISGKNLNNLIILYIIYNQRQNYLCVLRQNVKKKNNNSVKVKLKKYRELYYNFNFNRGKSETEFFMLYIDVIYKN